MTIDRTPRATQLVISVELDEHQVTSGLIDQDARIVKAQTEDLPGTSVAKVASATAAAVLEWSSSPARGDALIRAMGLCVPGQVDPFSLRVSAPEPLSWNRVALRTALERELERRGVDIRRPPSSQRARADRSASSHPRIVISTRRVCEIAAEVWAGVARARRDVVLLSVGPTIEAGLMVNGSIVQGSAGFAGMTSRFASEISANGLVRHAIEALPGAPASVLTGIMAEDPSSLSARAILHAARGGDGLALALAGEFCSALGRIAANLISSLNPEMLVIGGPFATELKAFTNAIRRAVVDHAYPESAKRCRVVFSTLGARARLLGAARLAMLVAS